MANQAEVHITATDAFGMSIVPRAPRVSQTEGHRPNLREHPMTHTLTAKNRDMAITARPAPLVGQLAQHPTGTRKPTRRTHGQVRAAENQQWRAEARRAVAALKRVTVR